MIEYTVDPTTWFSERELEFTPSHFIITKNPLNNESKQWITDKLTGRFSIVYACSHPDDLDFLLAMTQGYPAFEDPKEAIMYELRWA